MKNISFYLFSRPVGWNRMVLLFLFCTLLWSTRLSAQCSTCTYIVGSGVGIETLSEAKTLLPGVEAPGDACVKIVGRFDVDSGESWTISPLNNQATFLYFDNANSELYVQSGASLIVDRTIVTSCAFGGSWLGIFVLPGGSVQVNTSQIIRASFAGISIANGAHFDIQLSQFSECENGIQITGTQDPANHTVQGNDFYDCDVGIYMIAASNVNILYNSYRRVNKKIIYAMLGIHMESFCRNVTVTSGDFLSLTKGVSAIKTINLNVSDAAFYGCEAGLFNMESQGQLWIKNNLFSETLNRGIDVNYHKTTADSTGSLQITGNEFQQQGIKHDIYVKDVSGPGNCIVSNNMIDLPMPDNVLPASPVCGIEVNKFYATGGLFIAGNQLDNDDAGNFGPSGIFVQRATQMVTIDGNTVQNSNAGAALVDHFRVLNCSGDVHLTGNTASGGLSISQKSIKIENVSGQLKLCCNDLDDAFTGLYVTGPLNDAEIYTTTFGNHPFAALHYDQISSTGALQYLHGNNWSAASGTWLARFDGSPAVAAITKYSVSNANFPANGLSKVFVTNANPMIWFEVVPGVTEPDCNTGTGCPAGSGNRQEGRSAQLEPSLAILNAYPNPSPGTLTLNWNIPGLESAQLELLDLTGKIVFHSIIAENQAYARVSGLQPGVYFARLVDAASHSLARTKLVVY